MEVRTPKEINSYIDGYNACYKHFVLLLKNSKSTSEAIERMKKTLIVINAERVKYETD